MAIFKPGTMNREIEMGNRGMERGREREKSESLKH